MKKLLNILIISALSLNVFAQSVTISPTNGSALIDAQSTTKAFLLPRMTAAQRTAIGSPTAGMQVYQTDGATGIYQYGVAGWGLMATNGANDVFQVSGTNIYNINTGAVGINTSTPSSMTKLHVSGIGTYSVAPYYHAGIVADGASDASATGIFGQGGWRGVYGRNDGSYLGVEAIGVEGRLETGALYTSSGYGLKGTASGGGPTNYGVYGNASGATTNNYGIYGTASGTNNYAGYFNGNVKITGSISKGSGTFLIDHPLDPANKYLYHSFVESPDMMNIYNGNITTDATGTATITMPDYFEALNKDFRYQLTVIGTFAQAIISKKINGNTFEIKTNQPNVEVSWQVTGVRQDAFANAHRVVPEVEKEAFNKGKFLYPKELGLAEELNVNPELKVNVQNNNNPNSANSGVK